MTGGYELTRRTVYRNKDKILAIANRSLSALGLINEDVALAY